MNYGNVILITVICIVIFWVFMALRPVKAAEMLPVGCSTLLRSPLVKDTTA
jgi:hypothetical protein